MDLLGILITILIAAVVWWLCIALGLPPVIAVVAVLLVLLTAVGGAWR